MDIMTFKEWFFKTQRVEGECNCWLPERYNHLINSANLETVKEFNELKEDYKKYYSHAKMELYN